MAQTKTKTRAVKVERRPADVPSLPSSMQLWQSVRDEMDRMFDRFLRTFSTLPAVGRSVEADPFRQFWTPLGVPLR